MNNPNNKQLKLKISEPRGVSSSNYFGNTEVSKKTWKEKKKRYLKERKNKKKDLDSTLAIEINTTNSNSIVKNKKKDLSQIVYYNRNKKC